MKLHTGDTVLVISGKDKGKTGAILRVLPDQNKIVVTGINMRTRHFKKTPQQPGRKIRYEATLSASNVMAIDPKTKKPTRIGFTIDEKGHKKRIAKLSGEAIAHVNVPKQAKKKAEAGAAVKEIEKEIKEEEKAKGSPFWKKMGFGSAMEGAELAETPRSKEDQSIPAQEMHVRKGSRGS